MGFVRFAIVGVFVLAVGACAANNDSYRSSVEPTSTPAEVNAAQSDSSISQVQIAKADPNRMVCKKKTLTGSRFSKKVCMTSTQWEKMSDDAKKTTGNLQKRGGRTNQPISN